MHGIEGAAAVVLGTAACMRCCCLFLLFPLQVDTLQSGEIDYEDLRSRLAANNARPAIINVNIGTTVKGAVDDLDRVLDILKDTGYTEDRFYIHCDGALFGMMMPFIKQVCVLEELQAGGVMLLCTGAAPCSTPAAASLLGLLDFCMRSGNTVQLLMALPAHPSM